jgi:hypothetical protein
MSGSPLTLEAALLGQARYWSNDRKTWHRKKRRVDGGVRVSRPRTPAEDHELRDRYAELLDRFADQDEGAADQAKQFRNCSRRHPCGNAACPACLGAFQHGLVAAVTRFMKRADKSDGNIVAVSVIPAGEMVPPGDLHRLDIANFRRRMRERLKPIVPHCAWLMLGIDLSLNEDKQKRWYPRWCLHLYGFVRSPLPEAELKAKLKELFPAELPMVPRPVKVKPFKPSRYGVSYLLKPDFQRRITYPHSAGERSKNAPLRSGPYCRAPGGPPLAGHYPHSRPPAADRPEDGPQQKRREDRPDRRTKGPEDQQQRPSYGGLLELHDGKTTPLARGTKSPRASGGRRAVSGISWCSRAVST